jgi:hypothetical protein
MLNLVLTIVASAFLYTKSKGYRMDKRHIDKIDVKKDHKELIALAYRLELISFVQVLLYQHTQNKYGIK